MSSLTLKENKKMIYKRDTRFFHAELILSSDKRFTHEKSTDTYHFRTKGIWRQEGDTLYLDNQKVKWKRKSLGSETDLNRSGKLLMKGSDTIYYLIDLGHGLESFQYLVADHKRVN